MSALRLKVTVTETAEDQAARWALLRAQTALSSAKEAAFQAWLAQADGNGILYAEAAEALQVLADCAGAPEIGDMRREALSHSPASLSAGTRWPITAMAACAAAIGVLVTLTVSLAPSARFNLGWFAPATRSETYQTGVGERADVTLPDGSVAVLDTNSRIEVAYAYNERGVRLVRGQALFEVAKHQRAPFVVHAAGQAITAVGTKFNVRLQDAGMRLTLVEGRVRVEADARPRADAPRTEIPVSAGETLTLRGERLSKVSDPDPARDTRWSSGYAQFEDETLQDAVAEMNRYAQRPIRLEGDIGARYRVSGSFSTADPARFAQAMQAIFPLSADKDRGGGLVLRPRS